MFRKYISRTMELDFLRYMMFGMGIVALLDLLNFMLQTTHKSDTYLVVFLT
jgi:hypothetical protein